MIRKRKVQVKNTEELDKVLNSMRSHPLTRGHIILPNLLVRSYNPRTAQDQGEENSDLVRSFQDADFNYEPPELDFDEVGSEY